jgi:hypothetical protein
MPGDDGLGLEEQQGLLPIWPKAPQANPKHTVGSPEFGFASLAFEHSQLLPQCQILKHEPGKRLEASQEAKKKQKRGLEHDGPTLAGRIENSTFSPPDGVFATQRPKFLPRQA